jgi:hypothetical protein
MTNYSTSFPLENRFQLTELIEADFLEFFIFFNNNIWFSFNKEYFNFSKPCPLMEKFL